jgi:hypothetical protein
MTIVEGLARLEGYRFEVRYSEGSLERARAAADVAAHAYDYLSQLFAFEPDIAVVIADEADWESRQPYGLPFFNDDDGQIRRGVVVMPAGKGEFWVAVGEDLRQASPGDYPRLLAAYPDGAGRLDLQPFFDLITIHELGHAFEVLGDLRLPTFWLGEIFANLTLHAFVASRQPDRLTTLETLSLVGARSTVLDARMRSTGFTTLEDLERHYTGGDDPMGALNYVWYQYRWQRLAATMFDVDGEGGLLRFWDCFRAREGRFVGDVTPAALVPLLTGEVSERLGEAIRNWR